MKTQENWLIIKLNIQWNAGNKREQIMKYEALSEVLHKNKGPLQIYGW
jgi:hypothetical protein